MKNLTKIFIGLLFAILICISVFTVAGMVPFENPVVPAGYKQRQSTYVTMKDGTKISVSVSLPLRLQEQEQIPSIMESTRYGISNKTSFLGTALINLGIIKDSSPLIEALSEAKYAYISVDARGSGASFGSREMEWSKEEVDDMGQIMDWITEQPWSDGKIGTYGVSYSGNTAELATVSDHPALLASAPLYSDFDPLGQLIMPGGILNDPLVKKWSESNAAKDSNNEENPFISGIMPVDEDKEGKMLKEAVKGHRNIQLYDSIHKITYFDDMLVGGSTANSLSPFSYRAQIEKSNVPLYVRVGWQDAGTVNGAIERFLTYSNSQTLVIGPWSHGGWHISDPLLDRSSTQQELEKAQIDEVIRFFDRYLKTDKKIANHPNKEIQYYTFGEGTWKTTDIWPVQGFNQKILYFGPQGTLEEVKPVESNGSDTYKVDFTATTGENNRWFTNVGGGAIMYPDRAKEDSKLLTYTSEALEQDTEITGVPVVTLNLSSTAEDGNFITYLEDVAPDGTVTYITEGELRALHRKISDEDLGRVVLGPQHSFQRKDGELLQPGENAKLQIEMYATSVLIKKGHRIRIAIAGHDAANFKRIPENGTPTIKVQRNSILSSYVEFPMKIK